MIDARGSNMTRLIVSGPAAVLASMTLVGQAASEDEKFAANLYRLAVA
jgi:hypothetical protein